MSEELNDALQVAGRIRRQLVLLQEATKRLPVMNLVALDWLATEKEDKAAAAIITQYEALYKKYEALKVSDENVTEANTWIGSKTAKIRISIVKGADYLQTIAVQEKEVAENEVVTKLLKAVEDLKIRVPATKAVGEEGAELAARMRKWANDNGHEVGVKGRIPVKVIAAYALANPDDVK